jgi:OOP family OmpA-OmpF porin
MSRKNIYLSTLVAAISCSAFTPAMALPEGFTVGIDYGRTEARNACSNIANCDDADNGPKIELGYSFNEAFAVELGYTSFGTVVDSDNSSFSVSQDSRAITLSAIGTIPVNDWFGIYGRAGVGAYKTDNSGTIQGLAAEDNDSGTSPYFGAGVKFTLSERFAARVEFQRYTNINRAGGDEDDLQALFAGIQFRL